MSSYINSKSELDLFAKGVLSLGEAMYYAGAEISRVEESLNRLCKAYGANHVNVYAITSSIVVTIEFPDFPAKTMSRRLHRASMNLDKLEKLNELCRSLVNTPVPIETFIKRVEDIIKLKASEKLLLLGEIGAGMAFALFFGGNIFDSITAGILALIIFVMQKYLRPFVKGQVFFNMFASFVTGMLACIVSRYIAVLNADKIMIAEVMLLIPGIAITNSIQYTISGDSISGFEKLVDSILQGLGIAAGFALSMYLFL